MRSLPLQKEHESRGAKFVSFAGWSMPLLYTGIIQEHLMVRQSCGLFDVSHMGKIVVTGPDSKQSLNKVSINTASDKLGQARYTHIINRRGAIIDDVIITKIDNDQYLCICNASADAKVVSRIQELSKKQRIDNLTEHYALMAVQGPSSEAFLQTLTSYNLSNLKRFNTDYILYETDSKSDSFRTVHSPPETKGAGLEKAFQSLEAIDIDGHQVPSITSRTGYTGEDGFEILVSKRTATPLWRSILAARENRILPVGIGARDTLRLEKGYLLAGQDFDGTQTSLETDHERFIKWDHEFDGKDALLAKKDNIEKKLVGILCTNENAVPRKGTRIMHNNDEIGTITSGTKSPCLRKGIGLGYVKIEYCGIGQALELQIRDRRERAEVVKLPFV